MSNRDDVYTPFASRITVGLSSILQITPIAGQNCLVLKGISISTLEIGGASLTWGQGYPLSSGEALSWNGSGSFYLAASGATATVALFRGRSQGFDQV